MKKELLFAWSLILLATASAQAQSEHKNDELGDITINAQIRIRGEYQNGQGALRNKGQDADAFISERARLGLLYERKNLSLKIGGQNVGVWGSRPIADKSGTFSINEAWAQLESDDHRWYARLGRQQLAYDDERILGTLDWNQAGNFHDAGRFGYRADLHKIDVLASLSQTSDTEKDGGLYYNGSGAPYKNLQGVWYHYGNVQKPFQASILFLNLGQEGGASAAETKTYYQQTLGTFLQYKANAQVSLSASYYHQNGKNPIGETLNANLAAIDLRGIVSPQVTVTVGYDWLEGQSQGNKRVTAFNPLYGTHHKFHGTMDYFLPANWFAKSGAGLQDFHVSAGYNPSQRVSLSFAYHQFLTSTRSKNLGAEFDTQLTWRVEKDVTLLAGYSTFFGTRHLEAIKGGHRKSWQDWAWVSLNVSPAIFSSKRGK